MSLSKYKRFVPSMYQRCLLGEKEEYLQWLSTTQHIPDINFYVRDYEEIQNLAVRIIIKYDQRQILLPRRVLKGLINHSSYFRVRLANAIRRHDSEIQFEFNSNVIHERFWFDLLGGSVRPELYKNKNEMDLVQFIAAADCYGFREKFLAEILDFNVFRENSSLIPMILYCKKTLQWNRLPSKYFYQIFGLSMVKVPPEKLKNLYVFNKFIRDLTRSDVRLHNLYSKRDDLNVFPKPPFFKDPNPHRSLIRWKVNHILMANTKYGFEKKKGEHCTRCPDFICTASLYSEAKTLTDYVNHYYYD